MQDVVDFLKQKLCNAGTMSENTLASSFLDDLKNSKEVNSFRLLLCLGIDVKTSIKQYSSDDININKTISVIRECILLAKNTTLSLSSPTTSSMARVLFASALMKISPFKHLPCISCVGSGEFSRVYNFRNYMLYVVGSNSSVNRGYNKIESGIKQLARYRRDYDANRKYRNINITNLGRPNQWIFVADKNELKNIGYNHTEKIIDALGFYVTNSTGGTKYVCLEYDPKFSENTFQPDALTGDWGNVQDSVFKEGNDFYMSYFYFDNFGRTYSISGNEPPLKERVHREFFHNGSVIYKMQAEDVGVLSATVNKGDSKKMLIEAYDRFLKA